MKEDTTTWVIVAFVMIAILLPKEVGGGIGKLVASFCEASQVCGRDAALKLSEPGS